jgi:hypothetical protein
MVLCQKRGGTVEGWGRLGGGHWAQASLHHLVDDRGALGRIMCLHNRVTALVILDAECGRPCGVPGAAWGLSQVRCATHNGLTFDIARCWVVGSQLHGARGASGLGRVGISPTALRPRVRGPRWTVCPRSGTPHTVLLPCFLVNLRRSIALNGRLGRSL